MENQTIQDNNPYLTLIITWLKTAIIYWYAIMVFFKEPNHDPDLIVTVNIGIIHLLPYSILESTTILLLVLFKIKSISKPIALIYLSLALPVLIFNLRFWVTGNYWPMGLIVRPLLLSIYKSFSRKAIYKYLIILQKSLILFIFMWFSLLLWSSLAYYFYGRDMIEGGNQFSNPTDVIFQIFVMQTTANFPDIGLQFMQKSKLSLIFFMIVTIIHTMLINNLILATNYNTFKQLSQKQYVEKSIFSLLFDIIIKRFNKAEQLKAYQELSDLQKTILTVFDSRWFEFGIFTYSVILLVSISYLQDGLAYEYQAGFLSLLCIILLVIHVYGFYLYKNQFWRNHLFEIYECIAAFAGIVAYTGRSDTNGSFDTSYTYNSLVVLVIPRIFRFCLHFIINIEELIFKIFSRFKQIAFILFIVSLMFAALGEIIFGGINTAESADILVNAGIPSTYVYLNFNNAMNSYFVLFALIVVNNNNVITSIYTTLLGSFTPRIYFLLYYMLGTQTAYSLVLASVIDLILEERERVKNMIYYDQSKALSFIESRKDIFKVWNVLLSELDNLYGKTHKRIYAYHNSEAFSPNFVEPTMEVEMIEKNDCYVLIYFKEPEEAALQVSTYIIDKKDPIKIYYLSGILERICENHSKWPTVSVKELLQKRGVWDENQDKFNFLVNQQLRKLQIEVELDHNRVLALVEYYIQEERHKRAYFIKYDLPEGFVRNTVQLYINNERAAFGFYYIFQGLKFYVEKIRLSVISSYFGKQINKRKNITINEKTAATESPFLEEEEIL